MKLIVDIPDDLIEQVKEKLPPPESGMLEAIALDAILAFLQRLKHGTNPGTNNPVVQ
jgi:hypothetical protein